MNGKESPQRDPGEPLDTSKRIRIQRQISSSSRYSSQYSKTSLASSKECLISGRVPQRVVTEKQEPKQTAAPPLSKVDRMVSQFGICIDPFKRN